MHKYLYEITRHLMHEAHSQIFQTVGVIFDMWVYFSLAASNHPEECSIKRVLSSDVIYFPFNLLHCPNRGMHAYILVGGLFKMTGLYF